MILAASISLGLSSYASAAIRIGGIAFDNPLPNPFGPNVPSNPSCLSSVVNPVKATVNHSGNVDIDVNICSAPTSRCTKERVIKYATRIYTGTISGSCPSADPLYLYFHNSQQMVSRQLLNGKSYVIYWTGTVWELRQK